MIKLTHPFHVAFAAILPVSSVGDSERLQVRKWRTAYWFYIGILPAALFIFDAIKISLYHVARAPNASLTSQLIITFAYYLVWLGVTRFIWFVIHYELTMPTIRFDRLILRLSALGLILLSAHLFVWTLIHVAMYASAAWAWEPIHLVHAFGEVGLGQAGPWALAYVSTAMFILMIMAKRPEQRRSLKRFEVKQNGKLMSIPLSQIYWFKAAGNYVELHTDRGVFTVRKTLSQVLRHIGKSDFLKSHRGALVNASHVIAIKPDARRSGYVVLFSNGKQAPLSRRRLTEFRNMLNNVD